MRRIREVLCFEAKRGVTVIDLAGRSMQCPVEMIAAIELNPRLRRAHFENAPAAGIARARGKLRLAARLRA